MPFVSFQSRGTMSPTTCLSECVLCYALILQIAIYIVLGMVCGFDLKKCTGKKQ
jgi:hypothetical protein